MIVRLTWREVRLAAFAGIDRRIMHLYRATPDNHGFSSREDGWTVDICGALGEFVVAKALNTFWTGAMPKAETDGDVARLQVRATTHDHGGLIVHRDDPEEVPFVVVCGTPPTFRVPGWMSGAEAKQERWWRTDLPQPCFLVPQHALHPLDELVETSSTS